MEMKNIACAVLVAAASMSAVLAESQAPAPAPAAANNAYAALPAVGTIVGASLVSFFAYYMH
ncbi:unnamed protein product [Coffea canephora]|uniref:Arabinogalactan peptide 23-like n=1 Tax=Coffea canephora TaxID=49390 RepID=A0A068UHS9_COFCA|nr:unnamed protein product [Coffea canephora]